MLCWAVAVGIGVGIVLAQLALPALSTDTMGQRLIPPFAIQVDVQTVLQLALFLGVYTAATLTAPVVIFRRLRVQEVLRLGEE